MLECDCIYILALSVLRADCKHVHLEENNTASKGSVSLVLRPLPDLSCSRGVLRGCELGMTWE